MMTRMNSTFFVGILALMITGIILISVSDDALAQSGADTHTVQQGETLFSIASQYDVTVTNLRQWNNLENDALSVGSTIRVAPPADEHNAVTHTVEPGETLFSLSRRYNVSIAEIQQWNDLTDNILDTGKELIIYRDESTAPQPASLPEPAERISIVETGTTDRASSYYTVRSGDNLTLIAREHGMSLNELRSLNNLDSDAISVGQQLLVRQGQSTPVVDVGYEDSTPQGRFVNYRLQSGENTDTVLERFRMTLAELEALNPGMNVGSLGNGQQVTILLPPNRTFENPYRRQAGMQNLGNVPVHRYAGNDAARPTTSGELYHPGQLSAAHANMALGNVVYIENPANGKGVYVKINDRFSGDGIKLSDKAFELLGFSTIEQATVAIYLDE